MDAISNKSLYQQFVDLARDEVGKAGGLKKADAAIVLNGEGDARTVAVSQTDKAYDWKIRSQGDKTANNNTRTAFKDSIVSLFGGEEKIPPHIKDMMTNFEGKGKPLSARRVLLIAQEVDIALAGRDTVELLYDKGEGGFAAGFKKMKHDLRLGKSSGKEFYEQTIEACKLFVFTLSDRIRAACQLKGHVLPRAFEADLSNLNTKFSELAGKVGKLEPGVDVIDFVSDLKATWTQHLQKAPPHSRDHSVAETVCIGLEALEKEMDALSMTFAQANVSYKREAMGID